MSLPLDSCQIKNQLASDWMHQGIDLLEKESTATLEQAIRCFDEAIALRRTLPWEESPFFRYGLSAGWINRGDAMARLGGDHFLVEAVKSYDEALVLLESLPLEENILYPRRLAITWINRGVALQKQEAPGDLWEAAECFREAIGILEQSPAALIANHRFLQAGAWANLAETLASSSEAVSEDARAAARKTLTVTKSFEQTDAFMAEIGLKARHALCRLIVRDLANKRLISKDLLAEATDAVDEAMILVWHWKIQGHNYENMARKIFRFGCRIYGNSQPHFLAEFLWEYLDPEKSGAAIPLDPETFAATQAAIWTAFEHLQIDGFGFIGTPRLEPFLADIQALRQVEERLNQLRFARQRIHDREIVLSHN